VDQPEPDEELDREVTEQSHLFEVARTDDGWGVWDRRDRSGSPLTMYPPGDRGFEFAFEHFTHLNRAERWRRVRATSLKIAIVVGLVSGLAWIFATALFQIRVNLIGDPFQSTRAYEALIWTQVVAGIGQAVFEVSVGLSVILWLMSRERSSARQPALSASSATIESP
jgi:hypothetical protein